MNSDLVELCINLRERHIYFFTISEVLHFPNKRIFRNSFFLAGGEGTEIIAISFLCQEFPEVLKSYCRQLNSKLILMWTISCVDENSFSSERNKK